MSLLLASTSPRRRDLLALLGLPFEIVEPPYREEAEGGPPLEQARRFAEGKALAVALRHPEAVVIGSDTVIERDGVLLGKPRSRADARAMLAALRGRTHLVHTAVAVCQGTARGRSAVETVAVRMRAYSDEELERYLDRGEWTDKAGSYAIQGQGETLVEEIHGDYLAVVGLPLRLLVELLRPDVSIPVDLDELYERRPYANWSRFARASRR